MISQLTPLLAKTIIDERLAEADQRRRAPARQALEVGPRKIASRRVGRRAELKPVAAPDRTS